MRIKEQDSRLSLKSQYQNNNNYISKTLCKAETLIDNHFTNINIVHSLKLLLYRHK